MHSSLNDKIKLGMGKKLYREHNVLSQRNAS